MATKNPISDVARNLTLDVARNLTENPTEPRASASGTEMPPVVFID